MNESKKDKHPSYGMLQFNRASGAATNLFGSSIRHRDTIRMYLREGSVERTLNSDFYMGNEIIAEIEMSYSQFAEAITSMNMGTGVPVTIRWLRGIGKIENCPFTDKKEQFEKEFKSNLDNATKGIDQLINDINAVFNEKKTLTKTDKQTIMSKLIEIQRNINSNNDYTYRQFNEQMDKTVLEAKGEIEAFMQNKLNSIAQATLIENRDQLLNSETPVCIENMSNERTENNNEDPT